MHRYKYIDALRGIAIIMVILHHSNPYFAGITNEKLPSFFETILANGDKGVTLFFVMSAFTLCLSLDAKKDKEAHPLKNYFLRRIFRIVPLYYFSIILVLIIGINSPSITSLFANVLYIHGLNPYWINSTIPGGWSVGIEALFYLLFPLLFFRIRSVPVAINLTLVCMLVAKIVTSVMTKHPLIHDGILWGIFTYENIISQLPVFLIGICLYQVSANKPVKNQQMALYITYGFTAVLVVFHLLGGNIFKLHYIFGIVFAFLAFGLARYPAALLVNKATIWIGKLSYSLYLVHLLVSNLLVKYHITHYSSNPVAEVFIRFAIILSVSLSISWFTYTLIEKPFITLGKRIAAKLESENSVIKHV